MPVLPTIIKENLKLKNTWQVNLSPISTCQNRKCKNERLCYAMKAYAQWPSVRLSWSRNIASYRKNPREFFNSIILRIKRAKKNVDWFRWNSAGEIPDQRYLLGMLQVSVACHDTKFLVYTKKFSLTFGWIPDNLTIIASAWPGIRMPNRIRERFRIAWFDDGRDKRIPKDSFTCPGSKVGCDNCRVCWDTKKDIIFHKH